jgi:hypothetical protein
VSRAAALLWLLAAAACAKEAAPGGEAAPPPLAAAEQQRGQELCAGYVARLCVCAEGDQALRESCELARSQPEALALHLHVLGGKEGQLNDRERRIEEAAARKIVAACVKDDAALPLDRCPRR